MAEGQPHRCGCNRIGGGTASRPDGAQSSSAPPWQKSARHRRF